MIDFDKTSADQGKRRHQLIEAAGVRRRPRVIHDCQ